MRTRVNIYADVEHKRITVRPGSTLDDEGTPDEGWRYRMTCSCGSHGRWFRNPNDASEAAEQHAYTRHGYGE